MKLLAVHPCSLSVCTHVPTVSQMEAYSCLQVWFFHYTGMFLCLVSNSKISVFTRAGNEQYFGRRFETNEYSNYSNLWATLFQIHIAEKPNLLAGMEAYNDPDT